MKLFERLSGTQGIEFNNLHRVVAKDDVAWKHTRYMLGWVTDTTKRNADDDIKRNVIFFCRYRHKESYLRNHRRSNKRWKTIWGIDRIILTLTEKMILRLRLCSA